MRLSHNALNNKCQKVMPVGNDARNVQFAFNISRLWNTNSFAEHTQKGHVGKTQEHVAPVAAAVATAVTAVTAVTAATAVTAVTVRDVNGMANAKSYHCATDSVNKRPVMRNVRVGAAPYERVQDHIGNVIHRMPRSANAEISIAAALEDATRQRVKRSEAVHTVGQGERPSRCHSDGIEEPSDKPIVRRTTIGRVDVCLQALARELQCKVGVVADGGGHLQKGKSGCDATRISLEPLENC